MKPVYIVILAGGSGERLWPLSTPACPKQLLPFIGDTTLLDLTLERAALLADAAHILVVTCNAQEAIMTSMVGNRARVVVEPDQRNTGPAVLFAALRLLAQDSDAVMVVMPADHYIQDNQTFMRTMRRAIAASLNTDSIVLLGVTPTRPATGYGYIQYRAAAGACRVVRFHEKPALRQAEGYLERSDMLWNTGMFVGKVHTFVQEFMLCAPLIYEGMQAYLYGLMPYCALPPASFDRAVLERSSAVLVIPAAFGWSDVGNLRTFIQLSQQASGSHTLLLEVQGGDNVAHVPTKTVVCVGVDGLCIVETEHELVIVREEYLEDIKRAAALYRRQREAGA